MRTTHGRMFVSPYRGAPPGEEGEREFFGQIGERIRFFRGRTGMSLSELSRRSGIAKGTLSGIEAGQGNPTIMTLSSIARTLDVTPSDFIDPLHGLATAPQPLSGPAIEMLFVHRHVGTAVWEVYQVTVPPTAEPTHSELHPGIEHLFMLEGEALVGSPEDPVLLRPGMHLALDGSAAHLYWARHRKAHMMLTMEYARPEGEATG